MEYHRAPFIFNIYQLPIINIQGAKLILYADDTNVLVVDRNEKDLQTTSSLVMTQLEIWFLKNDVITATKTVAMSFHLCSSNPPFKPHTLLLNKEIYYIPEVKFLGMCITEHLSWEVFF